MDGPTGIRCGTGCRQGDRCWEWVSRAENTVLTVAAAWRRSLDRAPSGGGGTFQVTSQVPDPHGSHNGPTDGCLRGYWGRVYCGATVGARWGRSVALPQNVPTGVSAGAGPTPTAAYAGRGGPCTGVPCWGAPGTLVIHACKCGCHGIASAIYRILQIIRATTTASCSRCSPRCGFSRPRGTRPITCILMPPSKVRCAPHAKPALGLVFSLRAGGGGMGGWVREQKKGCVPKKGALIFVSQFKVSFFPARKLLVWMVGWVRSDHPPLTPTPPTPHPHPVDTHIPLSTQEYSSASKRQHKAIDRAVPGNGVFLLFCFTHEGQHGVSNGRIVVNRRRLDRNQRRLMVHRRRLAGKPGRD